ncbi:MAG: ABC transporter ATP-binding protein [Maledivibacter sp.]|jgi:peptide/nickel transport system ATP-binding protein|nr:ABC transporter ATP-binding protein [Maledivibacter sp.]
MAEGKKLLEIKDLTVHYVTDDGVVRALEDMNVEIGYGETLGFVGETGAGKTTTAKSIMRLLPDPPAKILSGEIIFEEKDLLKMSIKDMRDIRGDKISMIFQDPMTALNPVMTVGEQIAEGIMLHQSLKKEEAFIKADEMLETVGIKSLRSKDYPHQFSGGMKQRVVIAMALACNPKLLIADEPTTALDVTIQAQVLKLMQELKEKYKTSMIMITHDLGVVAEVCDKVAVIYAGNVVEYTDKRKLFTNPSHPYTVGLFGCIPDVFSDDEELSPITGLMPDPTNLPSGCPFHPRCPKAMDKCSKEKPSNIEIDDNHFVKCFLFEK